MRFAPGRSVAIVRAGDLEIDQDLTFQRRAWMVQRVGWVVMALLIAAALAGVLGSGPLSRQTARAPGALEVEYQRFGRYQDAETLTVRLEPAVTAVPLVRLSVNREFLDHSAIERVVPAPERVEAAERRVVYSFRVAGPGQPFPVTFNARPQRIGPVAVTLRVESEAAHGREARFRQFAYP
jgi:hypothetical protein